MAFLGLQTFGIHTNGYGTNLTADRNFDMIILLYRFSPLNSGSIPELAGSRADAITSLGYYNGYNGTDSLETLKLGDLSVLDNFTSGSGVTCQAITKKSALTIIAHEIGHRQFGLYHTGRNVNLDYADEDLYSIMNPGGRLSFSAPDRIKLGWANIKYINLSSINGDNATYQLYDANRVNDSPSQYDVLWIKNGSSISSGDIIVEARKRSAYWDEAPGPGNDDGDGGDYYLPNNGIYIYKYGNERDYSSLHNGELPDRRRNFGINDHDGYGSNDAFSPFSDVPYEFYHSALDSLVGITNIVPTNSGFQIKVWKNYLLSTVSNKPIWRYITFSNNSLARLSTWNIGGYFSVVNPIVIEPGVTFKLIANADLFVVRPSAYITANGTQENPIRFIRANSNQQWNTIVLQGNGNTFNWCLFDGASTNVSVESDNNQFNHCTFRNAWRGVGTYYNQSGDGQLSYFKLNYCMVEDNTSVGVVVYHADAGFAHTTIRHNASAGLWLYDSPAHDFFETAITDNATNTSGRDGAEVVGGSDVILFTYNGVNYGPGQNRIVNNPGDQVLNDYSSTLNLGIPNTPDWGFNGIFGGSGYRVNNQSSSTVSAGEDWWGTSNPSSSLFNGPVDYSYYLTFDPSIYAGLGSNDYPSQMAPSNPESVLVQKKTSEASSGTAGVKMTTSSSTASATKKQEQEIRRERMHALWDEISQAPDAKSTMKDIRELYRLHLMSVYDTSFATERSQDRSVWTGLIRNYLSGSQTGAISLSSSQAEHLMLIDLHEAYRAGRYEDARKKIDQYKSDITSAEGNIALMVNQMNLLDRQGSYQQELALLDKVEQAEVKLGEPAKQVAARYQIARENLQRALGQVAGSGSNGAAGNIADSVASVKPAKTTLKANYPNPFNPTTTISYQLAKGSHVRLTVWNILGRRVATLVDANQQMGAHQITFNSSGLASGVYFYRLKTRNEVFVRKMLLNEITIELD